MKKRFLLMIIGLMLLTGTAYAADPIRIFVDYQELALSTAPVVENGSTLVPLRELFEALGAKVDWDGQTQTVTVHKRFDTVTLQIGSAALYKNGVLCATLDAPAKIENGVTLVPVRAVSEALGAEVDWDEQTRVISIESAHGDRFVQDRYEDILLTDDQGNTVLQASVAYPFIQGFDSFNLYVENYTSRLQAEIYGAADTLSQAENMGISKQTYYYDCTFQIPYDQGPLISIVMQTEQYEEGERGFSVRVSSIWDVTTGTELDLVDIFSIPEDAVLQQVRAAFLEQMAAHPEIFLEGGEQALDANLAYVKFYLTAEGIVFYFDPYTLTIPEAGYAEVTIPFAGNEEIFLTDGVIGEAVSPTAMEEYPSLEALEEALGFPMIQLPTKVTYFPVSYRTVGDGLGEILYESSRDSLALRKSKGDYDNSGIEGGELIDEIQTANTWAGIYQSGDLFYASWAAQQEDGIYSYSLAGTNLEAIEKCLANLLP